VIVEQLIKLRHSRPHRRASESRYTAGSCGPSQRSSHLQMQPTRGHPGNHRPRRVRGL